MLLITVFWWKEDYMKEYKNYIVAFLDILGFKNLICESSFDEIMNIFKNIISDKL